MRDWLGRRRVHRYPIVVPILYTPKGREPAAGGAGWTRDLGEGGACVDIAEPLEPSTPLSLYLRTDQGSLTVEARVVWARPDSAAEAMLHGVAFTDLTPDRLQALDDLLLRRRMVWRAVVRIPLELPVTYRLKDQPRSFHSGRTENASRRGLLLRLPLVIPAETALEITLHTPHGPLMAGGTIVRVEPLEAQIHGEPIRHGFLFTDISHATRLTLGRVLAEAR